MNSKKRSFQWFSRIKSTALSGLLLCSFIPFSYAYETVVEAGKMSNEGRIWQDRNGVKDSGYSNMAGGSIAFYDGAWYHQVEDGSWLFFHEGRLLNLAESDNSITETLQYEVVAGTAFDGEPPGMYGMSLDGVTGQLVTTDGTTFIPHDLELLRAANGVLYYYNTVANRWWLARPDRIGDSMDGTPAAPYKVARISAGSMPEASLFGGDLENRFTFDIKKFRYLNSDGSIAGFHHSTVSGYRQWNSANFNDWSGPNIAFIGETWYGMEGETRYQPFSQGRYLDFYNSDSTITEALQQMLIAGTSLENEGLPSDLRLKLDGVTGQLVDASGEAVDLSYTPLPNTIIFTQRLSLRGVAEEGPFTAKSTKISLLQVIPLRNRANDPFNNRLLPLAISNAQSSELVVVTAPPPATQPPSGSCPLNTTLTVVASLPASMPLSQSLNLTTGSPYQLGVGMANAAIDIAVINPGNSTQAIVTAASGFTYISGSSFGTITEGGNLSYLMRRNSDSAEFEINFSFSVEMVFDDMGISVQTLTGRLCQEGGPV
ncbi:MAG: hypothetical protein L3J28_03555 [Candidatus Polarisedimenticolaceae bacterium]|nr:hypothetical protein [Candidatus Polarisedimenticolaceae bacterium]